MRHRTIVTLVLLATLVAGARAQSVRSLISDGNSAYREQRYGEAEARYREALEEERALVPGHFNLGNALEQQGKHDEALREFEIAEAATPETETKAFARYNRGNALFNAGQYREAADAFIDALRLNPDDRDAKFNLSLALKKLQEQQQQQQQDQQDKNKDKKDQQQQKNKDEQKQDQQQDQQQKQEPQDQERQQAQRPQEKTMSKADAERILEVLRNSEKDIQKKLRARQATRAKTDKDW